jgi:hypothetical protein
MAEFSGCMGQVDISNTLMENSLQACMLGEADIPHQMHGAQAKQAPQDSLVLTPTGGVWTADELHKQLTMTKGFMPSAPSHRIQFRCFSGMLAHVIHLIRIQNIYRSARVSNPFPCLE